MTLVELVVTLALVALVAMAVVPFTSNWVHSARTLDAKNKLINAYTTAKAVALRNPDGEEVGKPAASLRIAQETSGIVLRVCAGAATSSGCLSTISDGVTTRTYSSSTVHASLGFVVGGQTLSADSPIVVSIDNRGSLVSRPASAASTTNIKFSISSGSESNNAETGMLR